MGEPELLTCRCGGALRGDECRGAHWGRRTKTKLLLGWGHPSWACRAHPSFPRTAPHLLTCSPLTFSFFLSSSLSPWSPSLLPEFLSFSSRLGHLAPLPFLFPVT